MARPEQNLYYIQNNLKKQCSTVIMGCGRDESKDLCTTVGALVHSLLRLTTSSLSLVLFAQCLFLAFPSLLVKKCSSAFSGLVQEMLLSVTTFGCPNGWNIPRSVVWPVQGEMQKVFSFLDREHSLYAK